MPTAQLLLKEEQQKYWANNCNNLPNTLWTRIKLGHIHTNFKDRNCCTANRWCFNRTHSKQNT